MLWKILVIIQATIVACSVIYFNIELASKEKQLKEANERIELLLRNESTLTNHTKVLDSQLESCLKEITNQNLLIEQYEIDIKKLKAVKDKQQSAAVDNYIDRDKKTKDMKDLEAIRTMIQDFLTRGQE